MKTSKHFKNGAKPKSHKSRKLKNQNYEMVFMFYRGKEPDYQIGNAFQVVNDETGYTEMTLTFSITESSVPEITGGKQISRAEFEKN